MIHLFMWMLFLPFMAQSCPLSEAKTLEIFKLQQHISLKVRRMKHPKGEPVIISHALALNNLAMEPLGCLLWKAGFDVWMPNARGHGNGEEKTIIEPYTQGGYGFDPMVTEDWPFLLDWVYEKSGQKKVHIVGYSMGGMSWEQTLSGVYLRPSGQIGQDDELSKMRTRKVASFVSLTVPPDLKFINPKIKTSLRRVQPIFSYIPFFVPFTVDQTKDQAVSQTEYLRRMLIFSIRPFFPFVFPDGILDPDHKNFDLLFEMMNEKVSSLHTDCINDFLRWFDQPYGSRDQNVAYGLNKKISVPTLGIVASLDWLAPAEYVIERLPEYPIEGGDILYLEGFSHIDVIFDSAIKLYSEELIAFLKNYRDDRKFWRVVPFKKTSSFLDQHLFPPHGNP